MIETQEKVQTGTLREYSTVSRYLLMYLLR